MEYELIRSNRETVSIEIDDRCKIVVRAPKTIPKYAIDKIVAEKQDWIDKALVRMQKKIESRKTYNEEEVKELYKKANEILPKRMEYWTKVTGFEPSRVKITSAKKRFGSCSSKKSICFSVYLFDYPIEAIDYVIVHELCHIKEHNHSKRFWNLVESFLPDYEERIELLDNYWYIENGDK